MLGAKEKRISFHIAQYSSFIYSKYMHHTPTPTDQRIDRVGEKWGVHSLPRVKEKSQTSTRELKKIEIIQGDEQQIQYVKTK